KKLSTKVKIPIFTFLILVFIGAQGLSGTHKPTSRRVDPEFPVFAYAAHRGGAGLMPENTIVAMKNAIDLPNVTTLEMDLHISKDKEVVVTHNPYFSSDYTTTPEGDYLTAAQGRSRLLYNMPYDSIAKYDVGLKPSSTYSQRQKIAAIIPRLVDLIDEVEMYAASKGKVMFYDMEIKSTISGDNVDHPAPQEFSDLIVAILTAKNIRHRTILHSFDARPLRYINQQYPDVKLSYLLTSTNAPNYVARLADLGFDPNYICVQYTAINTQMVTACNARNIKVLAWTVNNETHINQMKNLGVAGIVTDYPNLNLVTATAGYQDTKVIITGYMPNPNGDDFSFEYVQLKATEYINFNLTPYSVITTYSSATGSYVTTAPNNGWVTGNIPSSVQTRPTAQTIKFNITSGEVNAGEIFYVGGSNKRLNGLGSTDISTAKWLRVLNYQESTQWNGDDNVGGGTFGALFGNNSNPQGIAVFNTTATTEETVPVDVVFFGTLTPSNTAQFYNNSGEAELGFRICDTDRYSTASGDFFAKGANTYVFGPTTITGKNNFIYTEKGFYDTKKNFAHLLTNSYIKQDTQLIKGDSMYYDRNREFSSATNNVSVTDTVNKFKIRGHYGEVWRLQDSLYVTKHAEAVTLVEKDSLYTHAKRMVITGKAGNRIIRGYNDARFYKVDMSGKCDSIHSDEAKGLTQLIRRPVVWNGQSQITGEVIHLISNNKTEQLDSLK
ncbi:MAG: hypothetical protein EOO92_18195, partial [Pedobacter sp.]